MNSFAKNNVVGLHSGSVYEDIMTHINDFESGFTSQNYKSSLSRFFMWMRGKELTELTEEDLYIRNADLLKYRNYLKEIKDEEGGRKYSNNSINNYIAAIQSLYKFLEKNDYEVKSIVTKIKPLADDSQRCGTLYAHEAEKMAEVVLSTVKGIEKSALIHMAYTTSFRKSSLLNIRYSDIVKHDIYDYYEVAVIGKGNKKHTVPISCELYNQLLQIKKQDYYKKYQDDKVFHLSKTTIQEMMDFLKQELNIPPHRNIKFHSFRNVASMYGTLEEAKAHYNHSSYDVTERYRHKDNDLSNSLSLRIDKNIDDNIFNGLSKEELIEIILKQHEGAIFQMKRDAQNILERRGDM
ncbi:tyrosine-type recombinase/integrase [Paenibacillus lautus]|uniref:tyrosine-type recombinase/integrase n=1 Tax=Paenibacillus lautus TaxID=1401 RepID=UPI001C7CE419|nr:site-specific integrase [Paenibacillus lautus]MBX4152212.1 site-specific integrase [Paenibacillus lautus]